MIDYETKPGAYRGVVEVYMNRPKLTSSPQWYWRYGRYEGVSLPITSQNALIPWRLVVLNRDGSVNREGALY